MFLTICLNPTIQKTLCFPSVVCGAVNRTPAHRLDASGKGVNVTRVLNQLEKKAVHLTHLGGVMHPLFLSLCEQDGLSVEWAESESEIRFCYTVINENDGGVTELVEESCPVTPETEKRVLDKFNLLLNDSSRLSASVRTSSVIISGTKAGGYSDTVIPAMVCKAKEKGLRVILDIKGNDLIESLKYEPDVIKPNYEEFSATFKIEPAKETLIEISRKYKCRIVLTNGSQNILAADNENFFKIDVKPVKTINTTGCGDAFTAGFASALENMEAGCSTELFLAAINEGMRCGSLNAGLVRPGVIR